MSDLFRYFRRGLFALCYYLFPFFSAFKNWTSSDKIQAASLSVNKHQNLLHPILSDAPGKMFPLGVSRARMLS
eukprot:m.116088 g.116088  ORF g.116088 m.116088 type:complete len:73 (+) comp51927_c0_seq7:130-348(+)